MTSPHSSIRRTSISSRVSVTSGSHVWPMKPPAPSRSHHSLCGRLWQGQSVIASLVYLRSTRLAALHLDHGRPNFFRRWIVRKADWVGCWFVTVETVAILVFEHAATAHVLPHRNVVHGLEPLIIGACQRSQRLAGDQSLQDRSHTGDGA